MISVIVTCYNVAKYVEHCLDSIRTQSLPPNEIICVEDCSTDNTLQILQAYHKRHPNTIRIVKHPENRGIGAARNTGVQASTGDYLGFVDSDDFLHPDFFKALYQNIVAFDADIAYCRIKHQEAFKGSFVNFIHQPPKMQTCLLPNASNQGFAFSLHTIAPWSCLYKRSYLCEKIGPFPTIRFAEDVLPFLKRIVLANKICFVADGKWS